MGNPDKNPNGLNEEADFSQKNHWENEILKYEALMREQQYLKQGTWQAGLEQAAIQASGQVLAAVIVEIGRGVLGLVNPSPEQLAIKRSKELIEFQSQLAKCQVALQALRQQIDETKRLISDCIDVDDPIMKESDNNAKQLMKELHKKQIGLILQMQILQEKAKDFRESSHEEEPEYNKLTPVQRPAAVVEA
jgi:hypothetical protein